MGHKIFVSYKYADNNVKQLTSNLWEETTVRDYVDMLEEYIRDYSDHIYKGESDGEDLSQLDENAIWEKLKNRIFDSTLTVVFVSRNMKTSQRERDQWIPWEISYSLKETRRKNSAGNMVESHSNAILAIVLPDRSGSYNYFLEDKSCCTSKCRLHNTPFLFEILRNNMFNIKKPDKNVCASGSVIYHGDCSYIVVAKWDEFANNPDEYIDRAYKNQMSIEKYDVIKELS